MTSRAESFDVNTVVLKNSFYVDRTFAQKHAHTLHVHHDVIEFLYLYGGSGRYQIGSREYAVSEGDMLICNQEVLHGERLSLENNIQTYCIAVDGLQIEGLRKNCMVPDTERPVITLTRYRDVVHEMMPVIHDLISVKKRDQDIALQLARSVILMTYSELYSGEQVSTQKIRMHTEQLLREITVWLDENYTDPELRMDQICKTFHVSESYLSHAFKRETGLSPKQYIVLRRVGEAQSLLEHSDMPIHEIETSLGFSSSVHLTSTFRKYVGVSPREYRRKFRQEQEGEHKEE